MNWDMYHEVVKWYYLCTYVTVKGAHLRPEMLKITLSGRSAAELLNVFPCGGSIMKFGFHALIADLLY